MPEISRLSPHPLISPPSSVLVEHFEDLLHERYGDRNYWLSRYSMVYAAHLRETGADFMRERLGYNATEGSRGREPASEGGGHYLAVHLRRCVSLYLLSTCCDPLCGPAFSCAGGTTCELIPALFPHWKE